MDLSNGSAAHHRLQGPIHQQRRVKIICVGAGAAGLLLAYKIQRHFRNVELTIYEKNPEVSGTWWENKYPGCACDVPSHCYTWSFEPNPSWSSVYAGSKEIFNYFNGFARKYDLFKYVQLWHQVKEARWNGYAWDVKVENTATAELFDETCDILINAGGILNNWKWPDISGIHGDFKGTLMHTADWDANVELDGKRIAVIGNGSSGIQVVPSIQPKASHLTAFIRSPTWVSPLSMEQKNFSPDELDAFANQPGALLKYRKETEAGLNTRFPIFLRDTQMHNGATMYIKQSMKSKLGEELSAALVPQWELGCRRLTPGTGYLEALTQPNVTVVQGEIERATEHGLICNGTAYPVDVLICATGFDTTFRPRFPIIANGKNLQDEWASEARAYISIAAAEFPNYLVFNGPNCPIGNGPLLFGMETQADYMCKLIDHYQTHNIKSFAPTRAAVDDFIAHKDEYMKRTVWSDECRSWYKSGKSGDAPITALWPGSSLHYNEALSTVRIEDFDVQYSGNRFAWLGNGVSQTEAVQTADKSYYIRESDDGEWFSRLKRMEAMWEKGKAMLAAF